MSELVTVFAGTSAEANLLKSYLEGHDIKVFVKDEHTGNIAPYVTSPGGTKPVKIQVPEDQAEAAKELIKARE